ncbi:hypothetical protein, partial [Phaeodactylibacter luteus]|uniref:hypothetical protein n=1 Tax=Phaeodactylibacter luteus TaxID=1564516 RepID=UPI001478D36D
IQFSGAPPFEFTLAIDGVPQPAMLSTGSTFELLATAPGTYTVASVADATGCAGTGSGSAQASLLGAPAISAISTACDNSNAFYTVSFSISGGDTASYAVAGTPGALMPGQPYTFTSVELPSGAPYSFDVSDANACAQASISGAFSCECTAQAGSMGAAPINV